MAKQRYINTRFWDDDFVIDLDPIEKLLFIYLLTNPLTEIAGAYEITPRRMAFDTGIDREMCLKILRRFEDADKIIYRDGWILVCNFIKHQTMNPKIQAGIEKSVSHCPDWVKDRLSIAYDSLSHLNRDRDINRDRNRDAVKPPTRPPLDPESLTYEDAMMRVYREFFPEASVSPLLQDLVASRVTNEPAWRKALTFWQYNSYRANSVGKILDYYDEIVQGKHNGTNKRTGKRTDAEVFAESADFYANYPA